MAFCTIDAFRITTSSLRAARVPAHHDRAVFGFATCAIHTATVYIVLAVLASITHMFLTRRYRKRSANARLEIVDARASGITCRSKDSTGSCNLKI